METKIVGILVMTLLITTIVLPVVSSVEVKKQNNIIMDIIDSPPYPPCDLSDRIVDMSTLDPSVQVILSNVPSSIWTYGCTATSAGMLFGYYDRTGYPNMYTGPCNGGVCPLTNLGQGIGIPIPGSCYIIATEQGHDGITTRAHVDDYYVSLNSTGDPWVGNWPEHTWGLCTADYLGTSQWKWDFSPSTSNPDGVIDRCSDGATVVFTRGDGAELHDYIPPANCGMPQTACCHGCRLFAESRGYTVVSNYQQLTDNQHPSGFTFDDFKDEIDADRPVLVHIVGHTMLGLGYDDSTTPETIFIHDTWTNDLMNMSWGGQYAGMALRSVTVIQLAPSGNNPPTVEITSPQEGATVSGIVIIQGTANDIDGTITWIHVHTTLTLSLITGTTSWSCSWDTTLLNDGPHTISAQSVDDDGAYSAMDYVHVIVNNGGNQPPITPSNPSPTDGATGVSTSTDLGWNGGDSDSTDILVYDVYFDTNPNPTTKLTSIQSPATQTRISYSGHNLPSLSYSTKYYWKIVANDDNGASTTGPVWHFTTEEELNEPPGAPTITGETNGKKGTEYEYTFNAVDPDGDNVKYHIDWGDTNSDTTAFSSSGTDVKVKHIWSTKGTYTIKATAEDSNGLVGPEGTLSVSMPRNRAINTPFLRFLQNYPILYQLLLRFLRL